jgi:hypothetical protein
MLETASRVSDKSETPAPAIEEAPAEAHEPEADSGDTSGTSAKSSASLPKAVGALLPKALLSLWGLAVVASGVWSGVELAFLVTAGGVLVLVIALMWWSVQSLTGSATLGFEEALGMGAPSKVEEQKRSVLRALKDLEFERGVGKISREDYDELSARYRAEAKRLMQTLDESQSPARARVEALLSRRLKAEGLAEAPAAKASAAEPRAEEAPKPRAEASTTEETP